MSLINKNKSKSDMTYDKENWPPAVKCSDLMCKYSIYGLQNLEDEIKQTCTDNEGKFDEKKYTLKWALSFLEILSFWAFYINLIGDQLIGDDYTLKLINDVTPLFVETSMKSLWNGYSNEFIGKKMDEFFPFIAEKVSSYFECKELWNNNIDSATCIMHNMHRQGSMQLLCDYFFILIHESHDCLVSLDITFDMLVSQPIMDYIKSEELDKYVIEYKNFKIKDIK
jgi:hypothetical protein